jgi:hypothetical protein
MWVCVLHFVVVLDLLAEFGTHKTVPREVIVPQICGNLREYKANGLKLLVGIRGMFCETFR